MDDIKQNIAKNLVFLRSGEHLTQAELAERLNYSDKAISKWERAESIPDITVLKKIADMFGVTVDWLISDQGERPELESNRKHRNHRIISQLSVSAVWFIAMVLFVALWIANKSVYALWLIFVAAVPASMILLLIFNCIWGKYKLNQYIISVMVWSAIAFSYLLLLVLFGKNFWVLFLIGIPAQIAIILWHKIERH